MTGSLFVTYGGGHVNMMIPIIQHAVSLGEDVAVLGLTTARGTLRTAGIQSIGLVDFVSSDDGEAVRWGERLATGGTGYAIPHQETVAYLGLSYLDLVTEHGAVEAARRYAVQGRQAFLPVRLMERILGALQPTVVITSNAPRCERASVIAARRLGIPSICLVDLFAVREISWIGKRGFADRVCVLSDQVRATMLAAGRRDHEVVVTGNPAFDRLASPSLRTNRDAFRAARGWRTAKVILWASQPEPARHPYTGVAGDPSLPRKVDAALIALLQAHPDWRLVIRPHPNEPVMDRPNHPRVEVSARDEYLPALLAAVDVVLTMTSTVGLEAAIIDTPVVRLDASIFSDTCPYADMGIGIPSVTIQGLESALRRAFASGPRPKNLHLPKAGGAADAVFQVIQRLHAEVPLPAPQSLRLPCTSVTLGHALDLGDPLRL